MTQIKRFDSGSLSAIFGLEPESGAFLLKPADSIHSKYPEPHRKEMFSLGLISSGAATLRVGLTTYQVQGPGLVAIGPDDVRQWKLPPGGELTIMALFFTEDFAVAGLADAAFLKRLPFYQPAGQHFIPLAESELAALLPLFQQMERKHGSAGPHRLESLQAMLRVLLLEARNVQALSLAPAPATSSQARQLAARFNELVARQGVRHRTVGHYAEQLCVSPKHLAQTVREQTGRTPRELIEELVCLEAKVLLQLEALTVAQVSEQLNFANPSFFGKFFKRRAGMSPQQYRRQLPGSLR